MRLIFVLAVVLFSIAVSAKTLVIIGDSITEGLGVAKERAFPALLEKKIQAKKPEWKVVNSGISGATTASAPSRMNWQLKSKPDLVVLALGANDGLRGIKTEEIEKNLTSAIEMAKKANTTVVLAGMEVPPNYGKEYAKNFREVFATVARKNKIKFLPFLLDKVGGVKDFNQPDSIHPNEKGHEIIADTVYKFIENLL